MPSTSATSPALRDVHTRHVTVARTSVLSQERAVRQPQCRRCRRRDLSRRGARRRRRPVLDDGRCALGERADRLHRDGDVERRRDVGIQPPDRDVGLTRGTRYAPGMFPPERIVCLTEETVETLYLLGEERRIAGVSGYAVRPPQVRREKPRVSAFISADFEKIVALRARPGADLLGPAGRHRGRADPPQHRGACVQPARRRRHLRDDPHARRAGRRDREGRGARGLAGRSSR